MSTYNGIVFKGDRISIPATLKQEMLKAIHASHMRIVKSKQRARDIIYWTGMNKQIEEMVTKCPTCHEHQNKAPKEPMICHEIPKLLWSKVGMILFEIEGHQYLIMVDYYSNFIEVEPFTNTRASTVLRHVNVNIARYGIMETLVSDNGPQYASEGNHSFMNQYGITHITSSSQYQQSNGLAE